MPVGPARARAQSGLHLVLRTDTLRRTVIFRLGISLSLQLQLFPPSPQCYARKRALSGHPGTRLSLNPPMTLVWLFAGSLCSLDLTRLCVSAQSFILGLSFALPHFNNVIFASFVKTRGCNGSLFIRDCGSGHRASLLLSLLPTNRLCLQVFMWLF